MISQIINKSCTDFLETYSGSSLDFSFLDPPFNQSKEYRSHNDTMHPDDYWNWMKKVCELIYQKSTNCAAVYIMQREKNEPRLIALEKAQCY